MPPRRPRRRRTRAEARAESRAALVRAGVELFARDGLDGPSLDAICERAGYTRGAFYGHFADRDAFLVAVMDQVGAEFLESVLSGAAGARDLESGAALFLSALARGDYPLASKRGVKPHQLLDACARSPAIRARYVGLIEESVRRVAGLVEGSRRAGRVREDVDPDAMARLILAAVIGAHTMLELEIDVDVPRLAKSLMRLARPG